MTPEEFNRKAADLIDWNFIRRFNPWVSMHDAVELLKALQSDGLIVSWTLRDDLMPGTDFANTYGHLVEEVEIAGTMIIKHAHLIQGLNPHDICQCVAKVLGWGPIEEPKQ